MNTYYRVHRRDLPALCAENAYSAEWGMNFVSVSEFRCGNCGGTGDGGYGPDTWTDDDKLIPGEAMPCEACCGSGTEEAQRGYSCCESLAQLADYFAARGGVSPELVDVYAFAGQEMNFSGADGEALVIPDDTTIRKLEPAEWLPAFQTAEAAEVGA